MEEIHVNITELCTEKVNNQEDVILFYILEGSYVFSYGDRSEEYIKDDILLLNMNTKYQVRTIKTGLLCKLSLSYNWICSQMKTDFIAFKCSSRLESGEKYKKLRKLLNDFLISYLYSNKEQNVFQIRGNVDAIMNLLVTEFGVRRSLTDAGIMEKDRRLSVILNYIHANYDKAVTLNDISEKIFLSPSAASRFFRKETGEAFVQYVRNYRLKMVERELRESEKAITRIAVESGFSNPSAMNKDFKRFYGITPSEYRSRNKKDISDQNEQIGQMKSNPRIQKIFEEKRERDSKPEVIKIDVDNTERMKRWKYVLMNAGPAYVLELADIQRHILVLKEELKFEYIRIWSLFSRRLMVYDENTKKVNFNRLDRITDFCVENGLKIYLDLGQRTNIAMASQNKSIYKNEEGYEFESGAEWRNLLESYIGHIKKRYGEKKVSEWIFEFSFFLNEKPYYIADDYSSRQVWESGYRIIKGMLPNAKTAGPGLLVIQDAELIERLIQSFTESEFQPDIFSAFHFPYSNGDMQNGYIRAVEEDYMKPQIEMVRGILEKYGYAGEYCITDWNISYANRNYIQDSCYRGAVMLRCILENKDCMDGVGIWYASDLINEYPDMDGLLAGAGGLLSRDGIKKPVFYAYQFLLSAGSTGIAAGENYLVTKGENEEIQMICFNSMNLSVRYFQTDEDSYDPRDMETIYQNEDQLDLDFELGHLETGMEYIIRQEIINQNSGSILDQWVHFDCEKDLSTEDIKYLKQTAVPGIRMEKLQCEDGKLNLKIHLMPNEIRRIRITKK